jgi:hypothetical protein
MKQRSQGAALALPAILQEPSWPEENRMLWALWVLIIAKLASDRLSTYPYLKALVDITRALLHLDTNHFNWSDSVMAEIISCLLDGTSLQPPTNTRKSTVENRPSGLNILHPYDVPHPPYSTVRSSSPNRIPSTPVYQWSSAVEPAHKTIMWEHFHVILSHENPSAHYARAMTRALDSPLQGSDVCVFDRLGFSFWDRRRICDELHLRMPPRQHESYPAVAHLYIAGGSGYISRSDMLFRLYSFYTEDEGREQDGWERG